MFDMSYLRRQVPFVILATLTIASGAIAGVLGNRWGTPPTLAAAAKRFVHFPDNLGPWQLEKSEPFEPGIAEMLECAASTHRVYRHRETGKAIQVALHVGPPGPTAVHTPDVCLSSQDFEQLHAPERIQVLSSTRGGGTFWKAGYRARTLEGAAAHLVYAWSTGDGWVAAKRPRIEFVGHRLLYKLQVSSRFDDFDDADGELVYRDFLEELLPRLASDVLTASAT
jgi:hypothetical protein